MAVGIVRQRPCLVARAPLRRRCALRFLRQARGRGERPAAAHAFALALVPRAGAAHAAAKPSRAPDSPDARRSPCAREQEQVISSLRADAAAPARRAPGSPAFRSFAPGTRPGASNRLSRRAPRASRPICRPVARLSAAVALRSEHAPIALFIPEAAIVAAGPAFACVRRVADAFTSSRLPFSAKEPRSELG
ncbi:MULTISPECIES: hypothetical protein [Burkholderia]|uniref:hypothetical protein n=1 Tax=Burkholderia TaxID=32008 RepID=UPI000AC58C24|nr:MULTISPECIES: hypothetical protein [Burkholderia]